MTETILFPSSIGLQEIVYHDKIQVMQRVVAQFDGFSKEYIVSDHGQRAALVVVREGEVLLTKQYRLLINDISLEIPGGRVAEEESPDDAARRECLEETGVKCSALKPLIFYHPSLDVIKNFTWIFYTENVHEIADNNVERRAWVPLSRCMDMIFYGKGILDGMSILALLSYMTKIKK